MCHTSRWLLEACVEQPPWQPPVQTRRVQPPAAVHPTANTQQPTRTLAHCRYALTCCSWFAKDFPRLLAAKAAHNWDPYDVEELRGKTMVRPLHGVCLLADKFVCFCFAGTVSSLRGGPKHNICQSEVQNPLPQRLSVTHHTHCLQGIVGYGDIGQACARLAKAFKMKVVALRRNTQLSAAEAAEGVVVSERGWGGQGGCRWG